MRPGDRDVSAEVGGRPFRRQRGGAPPPLTSALESGAEYVDIEWRADFADLIRAYPHRVVVSSHDFAGVPDDLCGGAGDAGDGCDGYQSGHYGRALVRHLPLLEIAKGGDTVAIGMGDAGMPSRLLAARFGSRWTYSGNGVAPGQVPTGVMLDRFRFRTAGADAAVYGVVGDNVMHSLSPVMHNAAFAATRIDAVCVPLRAADFDDFLTFADRLGVAGASVTIPFKQDALRAAHSADALTRQVGAANTLRRHAGGGRQPTATWMDSSSRSTQLSDVSRSTGCGRRCSEPAARPGRS